MADFRTMKHNLTIDGFGVEPDVS